MTTKFATLSRRQRRASSRSEPLRDVRVTVYLSSSEADELDKAAEDRRTPLSAYLRFLLEKGLESVAARQR